MDALIHAEISVKRRGGVLDDYLPIHSFMDSTKELCSDNRHRVLHTMWGVRRIMIPIFGYYFYNSSGKIVSVKDICEKDHILPDYRNKFIPTLSDFVDALDVSKLNDIDFEEFSKTYQKDKALMKLLLSPLSNTGKKISLLLTHNSWFINDIVPKIFDKKNEIKDFDISPSLLFENMKFQLWMDNGSSYPKSAKMIERKIIS